MANTKALTESILLLKKNKNLREKLANEGHTLYHDLFSSERIAKDLKTALNKVINFLI